jgi:hypothetical protein
MSIRLSDILEEIPKDDSLFWSILFVEGTPNPGEGRLLVEYENRIKKSISGLAVTREELLKLSQQYFQMFEIIVLGSKDANLLHRYKDEKEMYKTCDIVIDLIDVASWEIYAKDTSIIQRLEKKFKDFEFLNV